MQYTIDTFRAFIKHFLSGQIRTPTDKEQQALAKIPRMKWKLQREGMDLWTNISRAGSLHIFTSMSKG